jgi:hypothetical protein
MIRHHHREAASIRNPRNDDGMIKISTRRHRHNIYFLLPLFLLLLELLLLVAARTMSDMIAVAVRWVRRTMMMMMMPCSEEEDGGGIGPEGARRRTEKPRMGDADGEESYGPNTLILLFARAPSSHASHTTSSCMAFKQFLYFVVGGRGGNSPRQTG